MTVLTMMMTIITQRFAGFISRDLLLDYYRRICDNVGDIQYRLHCLLPSQDDLLDTRDVLDAILLILVSFIGCILDLIEGTIKDFMIVVVFIVLLLMLF